MAKVHNIFVNGRMDSDTDYSLTDNKGYTYALNLRPAGYGNDGSMLPIKSSEQITDYSENSTMTVVGQFGGENNKLYSFLARRDGLSKIIETDVITKANRVVISDSKHLRFDLLRWKNRVETEKKYLLSCDQINDLLFFSSDEWEYPRVINITADYSQGFELEDIILAKKPPRTEPIISTTENSGIENDDNDIFVSFAYRYKYVDGYYSALSFYSDAAFQPEIFKGISINAKRENTAMVNRWDKIKLIVDSGGKNVTDVEVYAREHGSNTAYLIYSANKKQNSIGDNQSITDIEYSFSKNYLVLSEEDTMMLFSNVPKFPKTQTAAGNRLLYGNYKEGYDIETIDFEVVNKQETFTESQTRNTAVSLFRYKVGVVFYNDFNEATTVLLPTNQNKAEIEIGFKDRLKNNNLSVLMNSAPPSFATKMKFVVKSDALNYENIYSSFMRKAGSTLYLKLDGENINKVKKDDVLIPIDEGAEYSELYVEDVGILKKEDAKVTITGTYATIKLPEGFNINYTSTPSKFKNTDYKSVLDQDRVSEAVRFISDSATWYKESGRAAQRIILNKSDYGKIKEGDTFSINVTYNYLQIDILKVSIIGGILGGAIFGIWQSKDEKSFDFNSTVTIKLSFFAEQDYDSIYDILESQLDDVRYKLSQSGDNVYLDTTTEYAQYIEANFNELYSWQPYNKVDRKWRLGVKTTIATSVQYGNKPMRFRTKNVKELNEFYYETTKTYTIVNGEIIPDRVDINANKVFDIGFYNGYCWGDGFESYKVKDKFNANKLNFNQRQNLYDKNGYKRIHRKNDVTWGGLYNYELGINNLGIFNPSLSNWKNLPVHYGEIQRILSTDGDIAVFCTDKVISLLYGKSILADLTGNENVALAKDVIGDYVVLPYTFGCQNPESITKAVDGIYFVDKKRTRYLFKMDRQIIELNPEGSGHHYQGVNEIKGNSNFMGAYDESHGEWICGLGHDKAIVFNPQAKGFSHYYDYSFDTIYTYNGFKFTGYKGIIYQDEIGEKYNIFAGNQEKEAKIIYVLNTEFTSDKVFKAIMLNSNVSWNTTIKTNLTSTYFPEEAYVQKETYFFSEIYRDNATFQNIRGIGTVKSISGKTLTMGYAVGIEIAEGDTILNENGETISKITLIDGKNIGISDIKTIKEGDYIIAEKQSYDGYRPDGAPMRGKWMEVTLTKQLSDYFYLTSASAEIIESKL